MHQKGKWKKASQLQWWGWGDGAMACHAGSVAVLLKTSGRTVWNWCQKPNPIWWCPGSSRTAFVVWDCSYLFVSYLLLRLYLSTPLWQFKVNVIISSTRWPKMIWLIFGSAEWNSCFWLQASTAEIWSLIRELCLSNYFGAWWWLWERKKKRN